MRDDILDIVYPVEKIGDEFIIKKRPKLELEPLFLARNPKDGELFLVFAKDNASALMKGSEERGLRFCSPAGVHAFGSFSEDFIFVQDGKFGEISEIDGPKRGTKPKFGPPFKSASVGVELEIVPFGFAE